MTRGLRIFCAALAALLPLSLGSGIAFADDTPGNFNLQVTPSPLVATVKPGVKTQLEVKIHNGGDATEKLKIEPRSFTINPDTGAVSLDDTTPPSIAPWVSFSAPTFSVPSGQWFTEEVKLNMPKSAGFSYSFALMISRQNPPKVAPGERAIKGSVAIFALLNVDRPGATATLETSQFSVSKHVYEYLPATLNIQFHNTGNTIVQPSGNIFIQRGNSSVSPLANLTVNPSNGYILPGTKRTVTATWNDGFPAYQTTKNADGTTSQKLVWNWSNLSKLRIGRYTAHMVAVYTQAGHDVPIEGTVSFWVIPWKILSVVLLIVLLILFGVFMMIRGMVRGVTSRRTKRAQKKATKAQQTPPPTSDTQA